MIKTISFLSFGIATLCGMLASPQAISQEIEIRKRIIRDSKSVTVKEKWRADQCAVIVCDMWDAHHCLNAVRRVNEMAPRMNEFLKKMRGGGAAIIHAPSSCTGFYKEHPARIRAREIPRAKTIPDGIGQWCDHIPAEIDYPLDQSDGGEDDDPAEHKKWADELKKKGLNPRAPWKRQIASLEIHDLDYISDQGDEVWSILASRNINNVLMVGVHTNMCVLGRPFGLRQLAKNGKNVILVRDLTDTMYNPARWPFVDHYQGNRLIHQHIEKYVCGTITSDQILGGTAFQFANDRRPKCLVLCAESLYDTERTLKTFSETVIQKQLGFEVRFAFAKKGQNTFDEEAAEWINAADLIVLSMRRRALPKNQLEAIQNYLASGKPLVAIRTSSHAFDTKGKHPDGHAEWRKFDEEVLGCHYSGHHANGLNCKVELAQSDTPILTGVKISETKGSLYKSQPLGPHCTPLLFGSVDGKPREPIVWTNRYNQSRVFYTSLGHASDFENPGFNKLLENGIRWVTQMKIGSEPARKK